MLNQHCEEHSGLLTWVKCVGFLALTANGFLAYSVFMQAPSIRLDIAKEVARLDARDKEIEYKAEAFRADIVRSVAQLDKRRK